MCWEHVSVTCKVEYTCCVIVSVCEQMEVQWVVIMRVKL